MAPLSHTLPVALPVPPDEIREAFGLFDKRGDGKIAIGDLGTVLRSVGLNPTESSVSQFKAQLEAGKDG